MSTLFLCLRYPSVDLTLASPSSEQFYQMSPNKVRKPRKSKVLGPPWSVAPQIRTVHFTIKLLYI